MGSPPEPTSTLPGARLKRIHASASRGVRQQASRPDCSAANGSVRLPKVDGEGAFFQPARNADGAAASVQPDRKWGCRTFRRLACAAFRTKKTKQLVRTGQSEHADCRGNEMTDATEKATGQETKLREFLRDEYLLLQRIFEDLDGRFIQLKVVSATVGGVAIGWGFSGTAGPKFRIAAWIVAVVLGFTFFFLEEVWKRIQHKHGARIVEIEKAFANASFERIRPFQIWASWSKPGRTELLSSDRGARTEVRRRLYWQPIFPHLFPIVFAAFALLVASLLGYL